jgi:hypothetical protein
MDGMLPGMQSAVKISSWSMLFEEGDEEVVVEEDIKIDRTISKRTSASAILRGTAKAKYP